MQIMYLERRRSAFGPLPDWVSKAPLTAPHPAILNAMLNAAACASSSAALPEIVKKALDEKAAGKPGVSRPHN